MIQTDIFKSDIKKSSWFAEVLIRTDYSNTKSDRLDLVGIAVDSISRKLWPSIIYVSLDAVLRVYLLSSKRKHS